MLSGVPLWGLEVSPSHSEIEAGAVYLVKITLASNEVLKDIQENGNSLPTASWISPGEGVARHHLLIRATDVESAERTNGYALTGSWGTRNWTLIVHRKPVPSTPNGRVQLSSSTRQQVLGDADKVWKENQFFLEFFRRPPSPITYWRGAFQLPVPSLQISSPYGRMRRYDNGAVSFHRGTDFPFDTGTPVTAVQRGKVIFADSTVVRGNMVVLDHGAGLYSSYWHLSRIEAREQDVVLPGEKIGEVGTTGLSTGPHLHFEMRQQEAVFDGLTLLLAASPWFSFENPPRLAK